MSLGRVPKEVVDLFEGLTGMKWPMMDPDDMYRLAEVYQDTAKNIMTDLPEQFDKGVSTLTEQFNMSATDPFVMSMSQFTSGEPNYLAQLALAASQVGDFVSSTAANAEYTKLMIIAQLVELLVEIAFAIFMAECGFFEWLFNLTVEYLISREFIATALRWLFKTIIQHVVLGVATGVAMDRIIQRIQINEGHRGDFDNELLIQAVEYGVIGGVLAGPLAKFGSMLGKGFGKAIGKDVTTLFAGAIGKAWHGAFGNGLSDAVTKALTHDLANAFEHEIPQLLKGFTDGGARLAGNLSDLFDRHLSDLLGSDTAREFGRQYAAALAAHWSDDGLEAGLRDAVHQVADRAGTDAGALLRGETTMLSRDMPDAIRGVLKDGPDGTLRFRAGAQLGEGIADWAHGNLSEGFYNLIFDPSHEFHTNWITGASTAAMSRAHHAGNWAANKLGNRYFPNRLSVPQLLEKYLGSGHTAVTVPTTGGPPPAGHTGTDTPSPTSGIPVDASGTAVRAPEVPVQATGIPVHADAADFATPSGIDPAAGSRQRERPTVYDVAAPPSRMPSDDARATEWQRRQQDIAGGYDERLADQARIQRTMDRVGPDFDRSFTEWTAQRTDDGSMRQLADAFGVPIGTNAFGVPVEHPAIGHLAEVRANALAAVTERVTRFADSTPEDVLPGLRGEFDRQALRIASHAAVDHLVDRYLGTMRQRTLAGGPDDPMILPDEAVASIRDEVGDAMRSYVDKRLDPILTGATGHDLAARGAEALSVVTEAAGGLRTRVDLETARLMAVNDAVDTFTAVAGQHLGAAAAPLPQNTDPVTALLGEFRDRAVSHLKLEYVTSVATLFDTTYGHLDPYAESAGDAPAVRDWDAALAELSGALPHTLRTATAWDKPLNDRWDQLSTVTQQWRERAKPDAGDLFRRFTLEDRQPGAAAIAAVRRGLFGMLGDGFRSVYPGGPGTEPDPVRAAEWDHKVAAAVEALPHMVARETARDVAKQQAGEVFDAHLSERGTVPLGPDALDRAKTAFLDRVDAAFAEHIGSGTAQIDTAGRQRVDVAGFEGHLDRLAAGLDEHLAFESAAAEGLGRAGTLFTGIADRHRTDEATRQHLASGFREHWFDAFHETWAPRDADAQHWLRHEGAHENAFDQARPRTESTDPSDAGSLVRHRESTMDTTAAPERPAAVSASGAGDHRPEAAVDARLPPAPPARPLSPDGVHAEPPVYSVDSVWVHPFTGVRNRAAFDARLLTDGGRPVTELTVRVKISTDGTVTPRQLHDTWDALRGGVDEHFNAPGYELRELGRLKVRIDMVTDGPAHLAVDLSGAHTQTTHTRWQPGLSGTEYAHEVGHQLGLREENRHPGEPDTLLAVDGSLMGRFDRPAPDGLPAGGLRRRHLDLLEGLVVAGRDAGPRPEPSPQTVAGLAEPHMPWLIQLNRAAPEVRDQTHAIALRELTGDRIPRPLTRAQAELWVASTTNLPGNPTPTVAEKWEYLRQLEQNNRAIPAPPNPVAGQPLPIREAVYETRDRRPWLEDNTVLVPPTGIVQFGDGHQLPATMPATVGRERPVFKEVGQIAEHIRRYTAIPKEMRDRLEQALREQPEQFFGEGYRFQYEHPGVGEYELTVRAANAGDWSRYSAPPTIRPVLRRVASTMAVRGLTLRRETTEQVRHIDDVHFTVTDVTKGRAPAVLTTFTLHNGLHWHVSTEATVPLGDRHGLPPTITFTDHQRIRNAEVEDVATPLGAVAQLVNTVFPDLPNTDPIYKTLHRFLSGDALTDRMPDLLNGWQDVPGANPPGIRVRAIPQTGRLVHTSQHPPIRRAVSLDSLHLGNVGSSVFTALARAGGAPMRDTSGWYGVYDARITVEVQRLDARHQPAGPGGRHTFPLPVTAQLRLGHQEATRLNGDPPAPANRTGAVAPRPAPPAQPQPATPAEADSVRVHGGDGTLVGLAEMVTPPPAVRSVGVPKAGLPHLEEVVSVVRGLARGAGVTTAEQHLRTLPQRLLSTYRHALGGLLVDLGAAEALITIDPTHPWRVREPSGSFDTPSQVSGQIDGNVPGDLHSNETINGAFQTGTHNESRSAQMGALNVTGSLSVGLGITPGLTQVVKANLSVSGTANKIDRSINTAVDAETGMVEDTRDASTLLAYVPNWRVQLRVNSDIAWEHLPYTAVDGPLNEKLLLWVPNHYLIDPAAVQGPVPANGVPPGPPGSVLAVRPPPPDAPPPPPHDVTAHAPTPQALLADPVVAANWRLRQDGYYRDLAAYHAAMHDHADHVDAEDSYVQDGLSLPHTLFASGLTNLPQLFDGVVHQLKDGGLGLPIGSPIRSELAQKLWNLDTNLKKAVNDLDGYHFSLHDGGRTVATVAIHTVRNDAATPPRQVGATTNKAHVEDVRTAIAGFGGNQSLGNSSQLTSGVEVDLVPIPMVTASASASVGVNWSNSHSSGAGRTGLWVLVSRYAGYTNAYHVSLSHTATVNLRGRPDDPPRHTPPVIGEGMLRIPEPQALRHHFPVSLNAVPPGPLGAVALPGLVRGTARRPGDPLAAPLPLHVLRGKGVGQGLTKVDAAVPTTLRAGLTAELRATGFLPRNATNPFKVDKRNEVLDSQFDNNDLLTKMVSQAGLDSHYDQLHQDGMTFTLTLRKHAGGMDFARVTVHATQNLTEYTDRHGNRHSEYFVRRTDEYHAVNLAMGMDSAQSGAGGGRKVFIGVKGAVGYGGDDAKGSWFKGTSGGIEYQRSIGASESLFLMVNRPELLEYPGDLDEFRLPSDYTVTIEYSHLDPPAPITLLNQPATVHLLPAFNNPATLGPAAHQPTPKEVLDQAVIFHLDSSGLTAAARAQLPDLVGPGKTNDDLITKLASNIVVRSHLKEIVAGEFTTDQLFEGGLWRDDTAAVAVSGALGDSRFAGATSDQYVIGLIKLWLSQATQSSSRTNGIALNLPDAGLGGAFKDAGLNLGAAFSGRLQWGWQTSKSSARTGAKELLELDFHRAYAFTTTVDFTVQAAHEKHGKLAWASIDKPAAHTLPPRDMVYVLSEHDALARYGENKVPIPDDQLEDALVRWSNDELRLSGNTVASILARRREEQIADGLGAGRWDTGRAVDLVTSANRLAALHQAGHVFITGDTAVRFKAAFPGETVANGHNPLANVWIPPYLTGPGPKALGHSGIHDLTFDPDPALPLADRTPFRLVHNAVEHMVPGLLGMKPEVWATHRGAVVGKLQGGIDALQSMLSGKREQPLTEDMMHTEGQSFLLINHGSWVLSEVVEVNLRFTLTGEPTVLDMVPDTGLENYGHAYSSSSAGKQRDFGYAMTVAKLGLTGTPGNLSGAPELHAGGGSHRGISRAETGTTEQTIYDWTGHYRISFGHNLRIEVRRLNMAGRPANNLLNDWYRKQTGAALSEVTNHTGTIVLKIPASIADAQPVNGRYRPDYTPLPHWPGDAYVTAALLDDALPMGRRLLADLVGAQADDPAFLSSMSMPVQLSRTHLENHLFEAVAGRRYLLSDALFLPGHSSTRARVWLTGDLYHLEVLAPIHNGTGPGRYSKFQDGTTNSHSSDALRPGWQVSTDSNGPFEVLDQANPTKPWGADTSDGSANAGNAVSYNQGTSHTENYRREQHVKQQGPTYMIRMRGRFRLEGEAYDVNLIGSDTRLGTSRSAPFAGDVYAELSAGELHELQQRLEDRRAVATTDDSPADWPKPDANTERRNLVELLARTSDDRYGPSQAAGEVVRNLRDDVGAGVHLVLSSDDREAVTLDHDAVREWARHELAPLGPNSPTSAIIDQATANVPQHITDIINGVNQELAAAQAAPAAPLRRPPMGLDQLELARQIAHELDTYVDLRHIDNANVMHQYRIDPNARVFQLDPGGDPITAVVALAALPAAARRAATAAGLTDADVAELYQNSGLRQQTFEQALRSEARRRVVNDILPGAMATLPGQLLADVAARGLTDDFLAGLYERVAGTHQTFAGAVAAAI